MARRRHIENYRFLFLILMVCCSAACITMHLLEPDYTMLYSLFLCFAFAMRFANHRLCICVDCWSSIYSLFQSPCVHIFAITLLLEFISFCISVDWKDRNFHTKITSKHNSSKNTHNKKKKYKWHVSILPSSIQNSKQRFMLSSWISFAQWLMVLEARESHLLVPV